MSLISTSEKKKKAIQNLKELNVSQLVIDMLENGEICCFDSFIPMAHTDNLLKIKKKIKEIEEQHDCFVYAIVHSFEDFGECFSLLVIPDYIEDWDYLITKQTSKIYSVLSYVWNVSKEEYSEFGSIVLTNIYGSLKRIF